MSHIDSSHHIKSAQHLQVGDYGNIDRKTGKLIREGNIYKTRELRDHAKSLGIDMGDSELQPTTQKKGDDKLVIASDGASTKEVKAAPEV